MCACQGACPISPSEKGLGKAIGEFSRFGGKVSDWKSSRSASSGGPAAEIADSGANLLDWLNVG